MKIWVFGEAMHAHTVLMTTSGSSILNSAVWSRVWNIPNFLESCRVRNFVFIKSARNLQNPEWSDSSVIRYTMGDSRLQAFHCCSSSNSVSLVMSESLSAHETYRAHGLILPGILHHWSQLIKNLYLSSVARHELKIDHLSLLESPLQWECCVQHEKNNLYLILLECFSPPQKYEKISWGHHLILVSIDTLTSSKLTWFAGNHLLSSMVPPLIFPLSRDFPARHVANCPRV